MKTKRRRRRSRNAAEWRKLIAAWQGSGESAVAFAARHDLSEHSLWRWRRYFEEASRKSEAPRFVAVSVNAAEDRSPRSTEDEEMYGPVELELSCGHTIRLKGRVGLDVVISLARELSSC